MPRALLITPAVIKKAADLAEWADRPANWYRPETADRAPGDNPAHVLLIDHGFRAVYSRTVTGGRAYRHLSISVSGPKFPHPYCAWTIASWFGFTGGTEEHDTITKPGTDWQMDVNRAERCFTLAQEIPEGTPCEA